MWSISKKQNDLLDEIHAQGKRIEKSAVSHNQNSRELTTKEADNSSVVYFPH